MGPIDHDSELARLRSLEGSKWNRYGPEVLPAWVADMDFDQPSAVKDAMRALIDRGDLGYNFAAINQLCGAWVAWQERRHGLVLPEDELWLFTGALHGLETALLLHTAPGDGVVLFTPIYYPFRTAIVESGRRVVDVSLAEGWRLDADAFERAVDAGTTAVLFSQPHNPTGRVFDADELAAFADVVERHELLVVSDEVWADLTHDPATHLPLVKADPRLRAATVTLGSASKAFNLSGLRCAVGHVGPAHLRAKLEAMPRHVPGGPSSLGAVATLAAWTEAEGWLDQTIAVLTANRDRLAARLAAECPTIGFEPPEATYLAWLDFRDTALGDDPARVLLERGGVALEPGHKFGHQGSGHARLNFATTEAILDLIIDRIADTVRAGPCP